MQCYETTTESHIKKIHKTEGYLLRNKRTLTHFGHLNGLTYWVSVYSVNFGHVC